MKYPSFILQIKTGMRMKRTITPKFNKYLKSKMGPSQSTLSFILSFAATYEIPKGADSSLSLPGLVLN